MAEDKNALYPKIGLDGKEYTDDAVLAAANRVWLDIQNRMERSDGLGVPSKDLGEKNSKYKELLSKDPVKALDREAELTFKPNPDPLSEEGLKFLREPKNDILGTRRKLKGDR